MDGDVSWRAGTASIEITPDEPVWLAGYAARTRPSQGVVSPLFVKALALEDAAGERFVLLTADLIAIPGAIADDVRAHLAGKHGVRPQNVLLAASHTHYGPELRPDKVLFFGIPDDYARLIPMVARNVEQALRTVADHALADIRPARLFVRRTTATFADNRRAHGDVVDHDVPVVEAVAADGKPIAVVLGYACHNTTIPPEDGRICSDWAGFAQAHIEQENPGCTALFVTGAAADQNPHPRGSVELSQQYGRELGDAVTTVLATPGQEIPPRLRTAFERVPLRLEKLDRATLESRLTSDDKPAARKAKFLLEQLARGEPLITDYAAPLHAIRFGDELLLIALSGEPVNDYVHRFKRDFATIAPHVWVAGYCNDMFGYVPTRRVQQEGGYEGGRANLWSWVPAPFDETVEQRVVDAVTRLVRHVTV
jgi:hypothetical protein